MTGIHVVIPVLAMVLAATPGLAAQLSLRFAAGRTGPALELQRIEEGSDELFVSADPLAAALQLERFWKPETRKLVLKVGDRKIQVTVDTRLVLDGDEDLLLRVPVRMRRGSVMLPLELLERAIAPALGGRLDRQQLALVLGPGGSDVVAIEYAPVATGTEVRVRLARSLRTRVQATSRELVRVQLGDAKLDPVALAADQPAPLVRSVRAEQGARGAALYLQVDPSLAGVQEHSEDGGRTLVVSLLRGTAPSPLPPAAAGRPLPLLAAGATPTDSFDLVVLDPGHGGFDRGVQGGGLVEKDLVLQLARDLQPLLERALGVRVLLVRSGDETLGADARAEIANRAGGDVLLSLHCNGWYDATAHGFEVLYAGAKSSTAADATLAAARRGLTDFVPWSAAQVPYAGRSRALAEGLQVELERELGLRNRGARPADVELLQGAAMPAVVVELGFLTDPEEAAKLANPDFAPRLGAALATALETWSAAPPSASGQSAEERHD